MKIISHALLNPIQRCLLKRSRIDELLGQNKQGNLCPYAVPEDGALICIIDSINVREIAVMDECPLE